jgi:hypothetical protein
MWDKIHEESDNIQSIENAVDGHLEKRITGILHYGFMYIYDTM